MPSHPYSGQQHGHYKPGYMWYSICSEHIMFREQCDGCRVGRWISQVEVQESMDLFASDFVAWYQQNNNGKNPDESAWKVWRVMMGIPDDAA